MKNDKGYTIRIVIWSVLTFFSFFLGLLGLLKNYLFK